MRSTYFVLAALAMLQSTFALPVPQIGGDAQASYYIINNVDNGSGYSTENIEDNIADIISGKPTGSDSEGDGAGSSTPSSRRRRQLNKIVAGFGNLGDATGTQGVSDTVVNVGDDLDTFGTNGQGNIGYNIGEDEDPEVPEIANDLTNFDEEGNLPAADSAAGTPAAGN